MKYPLCLLALTTICVTGCSVRVDKSEDGKDVKIATPFGSIAVDKNHATAADVGLPAYPGASLDALDDDGHDSARVDLGFGDFKLRVRAASYATPDNRQQVIAYYRKALSQYGTVIECAGKRAVGPTTRTSEGLTCDDAGSRHKALHVDESGEEIQLKAGSPHHMHLVAFKHQGDSPTRFSLVELDLPHEADESHGTN